MKKFWVSVAGLVVAFGFAAASADTISISQVIHLTGIVPPMRNIIVDGQGNILEITSNTPENVTPKVFLGSLQAGSEVPLTPAISKNYESKIQGKDMHSTDLHFPLPDPMAAKTEHPSLLTVLQHISWLRLPSLF